jgi:hypothetical protein
MRAAGSVGKLIAFRVVNGVQQVQKWSRPRTAASMAQAAERNRHKNAASAWAVLPMPTRARWQDYAIKMNANPWLVFVREYKLQRCTPPALPLIPSRY